MDQTPYPAPVPGRRPDRQEQPGPALAHEDEDDLTESAYLKIATLRGTMEARGTVLLVWMTGILGMVVTAYIGAAHAPARDMAWFLGLAAAELALTGAVILRITRRGRRRRNPKVTVLPAAQLLPPAPLRLRAPGEQQGEETTPPTGRG